MFFLHAHMYQLKLQTYDLAKNYRVMPVCSQITHLKEILVLFLHVLVCEIRLLTYYFAKSCGKARVESDNSFEGDSGGIASGMCVCAYVELGCKNNMIEFSFCFLKL